MKTEKYDISTEYRELAEEVISEQEDLAWLGSVRIEYIVSTEAKTYHEKAILGKCVRIDFFIIIYAPNITILDRDQKKILLHHELLHIGIEETKGELKYRVVPHDVEDFRLILEKYGLDWSR